MTAESTPKKDIHKQSSKEKEEQRKEFEMRMRIGESHLIRAKKP